MDYSCLIYQRKYSSKKWWEECAWPLSWWTNLGELLLLTYWVQRDYQRMGPFLIWYFLFHLGSQGLICLFLALCQQLECVAMRRKNMEGAFLEGLRPSDTRFFKFSPSASTFLCPFTHPFSSHLFFLSSLPSSHLLISSSLKKQRPLHLSKAFSCVSASSGRYTGFEVYFGFKF